MILLAQSLKIVPRDSVLWIPLPRLKRWMRFILPGDFHADSSGAADAGGFLTGCAIACGTAGRAISRIHRPGRQVGTAGSGSRPERHGLPRDLPGWHDRRTLG